MFNQARRTEAGQAEGPHAQSQLLCVWNPNEGRLIWTLPCTWALTATGAVSGIPSGLLGAATVFRDVKDCAEAKGLDRAAYADKLIR